MEDRKRRSCSGIHLTGCITHLLLFPFRLTRLLLVRFEEILPRLKLQVNLCDPDECQAKRKKNSNRVTFRGSCGGGNGVYTFFVGLFVLAPPRSNPAAFRASAFCCCTSFFFVVFSEVLRCRFRNWGRKRSQDSVASLGSLANSRRIMSS